MMCFSARALTGAWSSTQKTGSGSRWRSWEASRNESVSGRKDHGRPELQGEIRGGGDAQYGLFLGLTGGKELGVWYRTEEARKAAYTKLARQIERGKRQDAEDILYRLRLIEACINKTDKRTLRIWKQLQQLLHLESEETE